MKEFVWQGVKSNAEIYNDYAFREEDRDVYEYRPIEKEEAKLLIEEGDYVIKQDGTYWVPILE
jgi:hypothetical protein